jgi:anti-sigma B factor antagonist
MDLTVRHLDQVSIITVTGRVLLGEGDAALRQAIEELTDQGRLKVLLNLEEVPTMDSMALGQIVAAQVHAGRKGGTVKLLGANHRIKNLLALTRLTAVFETFDSESEAIASF